MKVAAVMLCWSSASGQSLQSTLGLSKMKGACMQGWVAYWNAGLPNLKAVTSSMWAPMFRTDCQHTSACVPTRPLSIFIGQMLTRHNSSAPLPRKVGGVL